ncbi:MAG: hypothetical protein MUO50_00470, partial [Longimicrobiales bacterium]|nr:hypothetical protein [Longimicrobiales bacterium]
MSARTLFLACVSMLLMVMPLSAQEGWFPPPKAHVGMNLIVGDPVGEFEQFVGASLGADFFGRLPMDPRGVLSLRADMGFLIYGHESQRVCIQGIGCRIQARLQTDNGIFFGGIGPELAIPSRYFRPYVHAFMGFAYFNTSSSLEDLWGEEDMFQTENFGDGGFSWGLGGGLEWNVKRGRTPIDLNFGARYHHHGVMEYLTKGDIVDNPDGSITMYPVLSEANLMTYHLGLTIGIPRGGD